MTHYTSTRETSTIPLPTSVTAFDRTHNGGDGQDDFFVAKFRPAGRGAADLIYSTYIGGDGDDEDNGLFVDHDGFAYVAGNTTSTNFPTVDPIQAAGGGGEAQVAIAVLNPAGSALVFSSYPGGLRQGRRPQYFRQ